MKNLTLKKKLHLLGTSILLYVLFVLLFVTYVISRASAGGHIRQMIPFLLISIPYLVFVVFLLSEIRRSQEEPLESLEGALEKISEGDFLTKTYDMDAKLQEEYGDLARAVEKIRENVGTIIGGIRRESDGISKAVGGIHAHMGGMSQELEDIFIAAEELSDSLKAQEEAASEIRRVTGEIEGAADHLAARAKDGEEWANEIRKRALYARETALDKTEAIRSGKKDIRDSLAQTLNDAKVIEQISVLAESMVEIMEQVNMLSLNAGLEASRVGEAGKEFVTIAEEIRSLADQSKKYAENIQWAVDEVTSSLVNLRKDAKRFLEYIDRDVLPGFQLFVRMADTYNSDAGEMHFLASDVGATSEDFLNFAGSIMNLLAGIETTGEACGKGITGIADQSVHAAARVSAMEEGFKETVDAAARLAKETGRFTVGS